MKFKVGDKVRMVGDSGWHTRIRKDIGKTGIVKYVGKYNVRVNIIGGASSDGGIYWNITCGLGIEKVGQQLLLFEM